MEIVKIILLDSAKIQQEDAEYKRKRHQKQGRKGKHPYAPLYTIEDAQACFPLLAPIEYREAIDLGNGIETTFYDAGHVLGSSMIRVKVRQDDQERVILFSGDIGRPDRPIVCDPTIFDTADYVLIESTYGDRVHKDNNDIKEMIAEVINSTKQAGGNIIVPSFALERSQELLYYINQLLLEEAIPHLKVFLDSPMASRVTKVFQNHPELFDEEMTELLKNGDSPFKFTELIMTAGSTESKAINNMKDSVIVIAGSGMCTGGRIKHHLVNNITRPESTIMFVGYQAIGTLGRLIVEGEKRVRILGEKYTVRAKVVRINGFSAHADRNELLDWLKEMKSPPKKVFVVHGEEKSSKSFAEYAKKQTDWDVIVPQFNDEVILN